MNAKAELELKRLTQEKEELTRRLEVVASNISLIHKLFANGDATEAVSLKDATYEAMQSLKRFTKNELAERIKHMHPNIEFSKSSLFKPLQQATKNGQIKVVQANHGNKSQAIYEWESEQQFAPVVRKHAGAA